MRLPATAIALLLTAQAAHAHHGPPVEDARIAYGLTIAASYWSHARPCAHVTLGYPPEPYEQGNGWAEQNGCGIWIRPGWLVAQHELYVCGLLVHEYGHLAGAQHSDDPRSVMARAAFPPNACFRPQVTRCRHGWFPVSRRARRCRHKPRLLW